MDDKEDLDSRRNLKIMTLFNEDESRTLQDLPTSFGVDLSRAGKRVKTLDRIQRGGHWVPYKLKPSDIERCLLTCEHLLQRAKRKGFLHRIVTSNEKWIHYDNLKRRESGVKPGQPSTSVTKPNIH